MDPDNLGAAMDQIEDGNNSTPLGPNPFAGGSNPLAGMGGMGGGLPGLGAPGGMPAMTRGGTKKNRKKKKR